MMISNSQEILAKAQHNLNASAYSVKDYAELFRNLKGKIPADISRRIKELEPCQLHLAKYWLLAKDHFEKECYEIATFFAITLYEEVSKIYMLFFRGDGQLNKEYFFNHKEKLNFTALTTLMVNSRVNRIYGDMNKHNFEMLCKSGTLFRLRNNCLYVSFDGQDILIPHEKITKENAALIVCLAGESYAEIQGQFIGSVDVWERLLEDIDSFRSRHNLFVGTLDTTSSRRY